MKTEQSEFAAYIGLDWADRKHDLCLQVGEASRKRERSVLEHTPNAIHEWAEQIRKRFDGAKVAVCLELAKATLPRPGSTR